MADEKELKIVITSDTADAERGLGKFRGSLSDIGKIAGAIGLERLAEKVVSFGVDFVKSSVDSFNASENVSAQLDAVLKSTQGIAGISRDFAIDLSKGLQRTTAYSDETVLSAENLLLTFTKIGKETFPDATKTVLNMSTALKQDTKSSAIQLGKALQDPILGVTALRRVGVNFSEDQQKVIKRLVETGDMLGAQKLILKELNTEFGESAPAAANTFAGRMERLKNTFDDIKEVVGQFIVNALTPLLSIVQPIVGYLSDLATGQVSFNDALKEITAQSPLIGGAIQFIVDMYGKLRQGVNDVIAFITGLWNAHKEDIIKAGQELLPSIRDLWESIKSAVGSAMEFIGPIVQQALQNLSEWWKEYGDDVVRTIKFALELVIKVLKLAFDTISGLFKIFSKLFNDDWKGAWEEVKNTFLKIFEDVKGILKGFFDWASASINSLLDSIKKVTSGAGGNSGSKRALGGYGSGMTLVGENGPELVNLPTGSYVFDNKRTQSMIGSGTTVNIYNPSVRSDNDITQIVNQVKQALGRENELSRLGLI